MFSKEKTQSRLPSLATVLILTAVGLYIHGIRVVDISDTPSSERPWHLVLTGEYGR